MCQNLPTTMTIFTMNTNIEMARSDGCQNLMFLALIRLIKRFRCPTPCKSHPPSLKAKVAVEAIKAHKTAAQIAQMFGVHPTQVGGWKKQALAGLPDIFGNGREQMRQQSDSEKDELYKQIGQLKVELDFLKKRAGLID